MRKFFFLALLVSSPMLAQTAAVAPTAVTGTAQIQGQSASCTIPRNGGRCVFNFAPYAAVVSGSTAPATGTVSLKGASGSFTCTVPVKVVAVVQVDASGNPAGTAYVLAYNGTSPPAPDANGNISVPGANCTLVSK